MNISLLNCAFNFHRARELRHKNVSEKTQPTSKCQNKKSGENNNAKLVLLSLFKRRKNRIDAFFYFTGKRI